MEFRILDKNNNPISINDLDREVCELVGNKYSTTSYCQLGRRSDYPDDTKGYISYLCETSNWFDTIGYMLAKGMSFQDILNYYTEPFIDILGEKDDNDVTITLELIYPYHTKVLNTWIEKGYQPVSDADYWDGDSSITE